MSSSFEKDFPGATVKRMSGLTSGWELKRNELSGVVTGRYAEVLVGLEHEGACAVASLAFWQDEQRGTFGPTKYWDTNTITGLVAAVERDATIQEVDFPNGEDLVVAAIPCDQIDVANTAAFRQ